MTISKPIKGIVFDMDGTLVDSSSSKQKIWINYIKGRGHSPENAERLYRIYNGLPRREFINIILVSLGESQLSDDEYNNLMTI